MQSEKGPGSYFNMPNVNAAQIVTYLRNIDFPVDKNKIIDTAKSNGAPENVIQMLNKLPDKMYSKVTDIESEFGKLK